MQDQSAGNPTIATLVKTNGKFPRFRKPSIDLSWYRRKQRSPGVLDHIQHACTGKRKAKWKAG
jgi:hypothetical protein